MPCQLEARLLCRRINAANDVICTHLRRVKPLRRKCDGGANRAEEVARGILERRDNKVAVAIKSELVVFAARVCDVRNRQNYCVTENADLGHRCRASLGT